MKLNAFNQIASRAIELDELYTKIQTVTGFTVERLLEMFLAGYTMEPPDYSASVNELRALAAAPPANESLTLEQLREMDGEPVYVHNLHPAKKKFEWQWALVSKFRENAETTTYTYRFVDYGTMWVAYRCPPEGEA